MYGHQGLPLAAHGHTYATYGWRWLSVQELFYLALSNTGHAVKVLV